MDNTSTGSIFNLDGVRAANKLVITDIRDKSAVDGVVKGCDYIFHQAAFVSATESYDKYKECMDINVTGTLNLLEAARHHKIKLFVNASSCAVYDPISPYAVSKLAAERCVDMYYTQYELPTISLRYFNVYGLNQNPVYSAVIPNFVKAAVKNTRPIIYGDGLQARDFVHVSDIVAANLKCIDNIKDIAGDTFDIGTGNTEDLQCLIGILCNIMGKKLEEVPIMYRKARTNDVLYSISDIRKAETFLGYKPQVNLTEGLKKMIKEYE